MNNKVTDNSGDRKYFNQTPFVVWAKCSDPYEYALWNVVKMIAGTDGECYINTNDLAALSMMSIGKVASCRQSLVEKGLLEGEKRIHDGHQLPVWHLRIPDLWPENIAMATKFTKIKDKVDYKNLQKAGTSNNAYGFSPGEKPSTQDEKLSTPSEKPSTPGETNNNKNNNQEEEPKGGNTAIQDHRAEPSAQLPPQPATPNQAQAQVVEPALASAERTQPQAQSVVPATGRVTVQPSTQAEPFPPSMGSQARVLPSQRGLEGLMQAGANKFANNGRVAYSTGEWANTTIYAEQAQATGIAPEEFTAITNALLDASKKRNFVDNNPDDPDSESILNDHKAAALWFVQNGCKTEKGVQAVVTSFFEENSGFAKTRTVSLKQLKIHASNMPNFGKEPVTANQPATPPTPATANVVSAFDEEELAIETAKFLHTAIHRGSKPYPADLLARIERHEKERQARRKAA